MKILGILIILIFSSPLQAQSACKCNCDRTKATLCASGYDLDNPCIGLCPIQAPATPMGNTACPTTLVYNPIKGVNEWLTTCAD